MEFIRRDRPSLWKTAALVLRARDDAPSAVQSLRAIFVPLFSALFMSAFLMLAIVRRGSPVAGDALRFFFVATVSTFLTPLIVGFEAQRTQAFSFLRVVPHPVAPKWLVLLPSCASGGIIALASLAVLPFQAALALLGCWCWAASVGHAFAGRRVATVALVGWPLSFLPLVTALVLFSRVGWHWAAAAALAFGVVGCLAAPRDRLIPLVSAGSHRTAEHQTCSVPPWGLFAAHQGRWRPRGAALRIFRLTAAIPDNSRVNLSGILPVLIGLDVFGMLMALVLPARAMMMMVGVPIVAGSRLASAMSPAVAEFMSTRPLPRASWVRGAILPWILIVAAVPVTALLRAGTAATMRRTDLAPLSYSDATIPSALTPGHAAPGARWQAAIVVSPPLRRLRLAHLGRMSILHLAVFAGVAGIGLAGRRGRRREKRIASGLAIVSVALMTGAGLPMLRAWGPGPLWLISLAVAACAWALLRDLMVGSKGAPARVRARPTGAPGNEAT